MDENLQQLAQQLGPQFIDEGAMEVVQEIIEDGLTPDEVMPALEMIELVLQQPEAYPEVRAELIAQDFLDEEDLPLEFDPQEIGVIYLVLTRAIEMLSSGEVQQMQQGVSSGMPEPMAMGMLSGMEDSMPPGMQPPQQFAKGGLAKIADDLAGMGRYGDTMLAHINPKEAAMLKRMGGSGTINPRTGLPEFFGFVKKAFKKVVNVAKKVVGKVTNALGPAGTGILLSIAAPWAIPALGGALGIGSLGAGALYGGLSSAATGGNVVQGALLGGLGGGLGDAVGGYANNTLGLGLGESAKQLLGSSLVGGAAGAATGQGFLPGAVQGAIGQYAGSALQGLGGKFAGGVGAGINQAGKQFGNMLTAGFDPRSAALTGGLSGLASALTYQPVKSNTFRGLKSPSDSVVEGLRQPTTTGMPSSDFGNYGEDLTGQMAFRDGTGVNYSTGQNTGQYMEVPGGTQMSANIGQPQIDLSGGQAAAGATGSGGFDVGNLLKYGTLAATAGSLFAKPPEIQQQLQQLPADKQEYFNRPSVAWDWGRLTQDAAQNGTTLAEYVAVNWPKITSGRYNVQPGQPGQTVQMAKGGALDMIAGYMKGGGSGRSDNIDAKLSPGEYIMDAETVALLGDGSSEEGGRRLEAMRKQIRQHKGKALAKGKFSQNAKSPLDYIKGAL